jgi:cyclopropane fatty-acyl-phospholipid synthase-like methyltransferase
MSERKAHWEKVYREKSPDAVSWYQREPVLSMALIEKAALPADAPLIDVGGGASVLVDCLCESGYSNVSVLDVSAAALEHSRRRLAQKGYRAHWYEEDVTRFRPPHRFALWHDRAVFHFLTDQADRESYVRVLKNALEPGAQVLIMTFATDGPTRCSGLDIVQYDDDKLRAELGACFELLEWGHETHLTPSGNQQRFAWFRFSYAKEADK